MAASEPRGRGWRILRYLLGGALVLATVAASLGGLQWYLSLVLICMALLIVVGRRRIFRVGISRTADQIVCRYVPWYEGNAYVLNVALPLMGVASVAAGVAPGNPAWLRYTGAVLLCVTPLFVYATVRMWRRCFLRISPDALAVRLAVLKAVPVEIRREVVQSIAPKIVPNGVSGGSLQVEITYHDVQSPRDAPKTVLLGLQLSVQPLDLLNALAAWGDATDADPNELLNRIERILRGQSMAGV